MDPSRTNMEQTVLERAASGQGSDMDFSSQSEVPSDDATAVTRTSKTVVLRTTGVFFLFMGKRAL